MIMAFGAFLSLGCLAALFYIGSQAEPARGPRGEKLSFTASMSHSFTQVKKEASTGVVRARLLWTVGGPGSIRALGTRLAAGKVSAQDMAIVESVRDIVGLPQSFVSNAKAGRISDAHANRIMKAAGFSGAGKSSATLR